MPASSSLDAKAAPCRRIGRPPTLAASPRANVCLVSAFAPSVYPCRSIHSELNLIACFLCSSRCCCTRARAHTSLILVRTRFVLHSPARPHKFCPLPPPACALRTAWVNPAMMTTMHRWTICPHPHPLTATTIAHTRPQCHEILCIRIEMCCCNYCIRSVVAPYHFTIAWTVCAKLHMALTSLESLL